MDTVSQIKEILQNELQGFEYCLNNKGAWSTPDGIKDLIIGMIETKSALQKYLTEFETAINARTQPTPDSFPDGWETEWQPSFEAVTIGTKPAPKYKLDEPMTPPRLTAEDLQLLEFEASELVNRKPETPENIARVAEIEAILQGEELRSARDETATNYYNYKVYTEEADMIAMQAIEKQFNDKWTVARRNALLADAYIAHIALEETHTAYDAAFEAYQEYIFNRDYVIPPGHAANSLPILYDNRTVLID